jgi:hypothetical protein
MNASEYYLDNLGLFRTTFICRFVDYFGNADSALTIGHQGNLSHIQIDLDYCLTVTATVFSTFEDIGMTIRLCHGEDRVAYGKMERKVASLVSRQTAVLVTCDSFMLDDNEITVFDPKIVPLNFKF